MSDPDRRTSEDGNGADDPDGVPSDVGAAVAEQPTDLLAVVGELYRGEVNQATTAQDRIDRTTDWAIALIAALLSVVFSSPEMPADLLLIGMLMLGVFLFYESRRYRTYDAFRARVRFVQQNVYADALHPIGAEHGDWREELSDDLRRPTVKITFWEALARRLRRMYGLLFVILGVAWVAKVTIFTPEGNWLETAAVPGVPGAVVLGALVAFYALLGVVAFWPRKRQAMGEVYGEEPGDWKTDDEI